jgi:hypothetical protein
MRKTLRKPSSRKPTSRKCKLLARLREELASFHFWVDTMTMVASIATVAALIATAIQLNWLRHDRTDQANIAAWSLLQNYLQSDHRAQSDQGQGFALETLVKNHVELVNLDVHDIHLENTNLHGTNAQDSTFRHAYLRSVDLSNADLSNADFEGAVFESCNCAYTQFWGANLHRAFLDGNFISAHFDLADVSDLKPWSITVKTYSDKDVIEGPRIIEAHPSINPEALKEACFEVGHKPQFPNVNMPEDPQRSDCFDEWGEIWAERYRQSHPSDYPSSR